MRFGFNSMPRSASASSSNRRSRMGFGESGSLDRFTLLLADVRVEATMIRQSASSIILPAPQRRADRSTGGRRIMMDSTCSLRSELGRSTDVTTCKLLRSHLRYLTAPCMTCTLQTSNRAGYVLVPQNKFQASQAKHFCSTHYL